MPRGGCLTLMVAWAEGLREGPIGRKAALSRARGLAAVPVAFALTRGLVRMLRAVLELSLLARCHARKTRA